MPSLFVVFGLKLFVKMITNTECEMMGNLPLLKKISPEKNPNNSGFTNFWLLLIAPVQPTGTLGVECFCPCHPTQTSTRSWRNTSPQKTCWLSEMPSYLSRQRYNVFPLYVHTSGISTKGRTAPLTKDVLGVGVRVLVQCPKTHSQPGEDAPYQAVVQSEPHLSPGSPSIRPPGIREPPGQESQPSLCSVHAA